MKVRFIYAGFQRHADAHPELRSFVPCNEYFGPPSLGIASIAATTPPHWEFDFRDDRLEDIGLDDGSIDLVAISCFTPSAKRAMQIADQCKERGIRVVMGGIFPTMMPEETLKHADAVICGEGEGIWAQVLADVEQGTLKKQYQETSPFDLSKLPLPRVDLYMQKEGATFCPDDYPVQISRGCPLSCFACAIPKTAGKKLRHLPMEYVLGQVDQLEKRGKLASFTEDTSFFPGSGTLRRFGEILDALAARGRKANVSYIGISMPMILTTPESYFHRMRDAGVNMFYLVGGFDPITRGAFTGKDPRALERAEEAIRKTMSLGIEPYTSFLLGNEDDNVGTMDRMLEFANKTGIRKAEFAIMTPYPGTPIWYELLKQERILTKDWSLYNDANVVFQPKNFTPETLLRGYLYLWKEFYRSRQSLADLSRNERTIQF